jgi:hypothetical protein
MTYKMTDRLFSRLWRRNKRYSEHELRWLAGRRGLKLEQKGTLITLTGPRTSLHFSGAEDQSAAPASFGKL